MRGCVTTSIIGQLRDGQMDVVIRHLSSINCGMWGIRGCFKMFIINQLLDGGMGGCFTIPIIRQLWGRGGNWEVPLRYLLSVNCKLRKWEVALCYLSSVSGGIGKMGDCFKSVISQL